MIDGIICILKLHQGHVQGRPICLRVNSVTSLFFVIANFDLRSGSVSELTLRRPAFGIGSKNDTMRLQDGCQGQPIRALL